MAVRRTRIVCIADTHNQTPKLPPGDVLIHAGDLTNHGSYSELHKAFKWLQDAEFQVKIVVCGNHDIGCDAPFSRQYGAYFHQKSQETPEQCMRLMRSDPSITYLSHESKAIRVTHADGAVTRLTVFGSPYSPAKGFWAFGYPPATAAALWDQIPLDTDIVVAHTPAKFHRDECGTRGAAGCEVLRQALWRVRPRLFVCGHIHEAYGVEAVTWDLSSPFIAFKEHGVRAWRDPHPDGKKQFTVDVSARAGSVALQYDGAATHTTEAGAEVAPVLRVPPPAALLPAVPPPPRPPFPDFDKAQLPILPTPHDVDGRPSVIRAHDEPGTRATSYREAVCGREGRRETLMVNAAFMASNWPHRAGKKFHKPIVIDLDLPVEYGAAGFS